MSFINRRTKAQFYNDSSITFFVQKDCVDIIFKVKRGVYLTVSVYSLSGNRLLLACLWDGFWNRLRHMNNRKYVISRLEKTCPLTSGIFTNASSTHFAYIDKKREIGAMVLEMTAPVQSNSIVDFLHGQVIDNAMKLMEFNIDLYCELEDKCPFAVWKEDLIRLKG